MSTVSSTIARVGLIAGAVAAAAVAGWALVHRTAPAVRRWRPGDGERREPAPLAARVLGDGEIVVVLLSGLAANGELWGAAFDALEPDATVVAIDPLGFGASRDATWSSTDAEDSHVAALDATLASLGLAGRPIVAVGHSFGANLALRWAARTPSIRGVVAISAPLFGTQREAEKRIAQMGWMESLLASGPIAERLCAWMCAHPVAAARAAVVLSPRLPTSIAAASVQHSWATYLTNFDGIVRDEGWRPAIERLRDRGAHVEFLYGDRDAARVPGRLEATLARWPEARLTLVPGGHQLPLTDPEACIRPIRRLLEITSTDAAAEDDVLHGSPLVRPGDARRA